MSVEVSSPGSGHGHPVRAHAVGLRALARAGSCGSASRWEPAQPRGGGGAQGAGPPPPTAGGRGRRG